MTRIEEFIRLIFEYFKGAFGGKSITNSKLVANMIE